MRVFYAFSFFLITALAFVYSNNEKPWSLVYKGNLSTARGLASTGEENSQIFIAADLISSEQNFRKNLAANTRLDLAETSLVIQYPNEMLQTSKTEFKLICDIYQEVSFVFTSEELAPHGAPTKLIWTQTCPQTENKWLKSGSLAMDDIYNSIFQKENYPEMTWKNLYVPPQVLKLSALKLVSSAETLEVKLQEQTPFNIRN